MTTAVVIPSSPDPPHRDVIVDDTGAVIGAVCFYPKRWTWTITVGRRVCSVYARPDGWDIAAEVEARGVVAQMKAHRGARCEAGFRAGAVCCCPGAAA